MIPAEAGNLTYTSSDEKVAKVVADHIVNGNVVSEYTVGNIK